MRYLFTRFNKQKSKTSLFVGLSVISGMLGIMVAFTAPQHTAAEEEATFRGNTHINEYIQANWNSTVARGIPYPARTEAKVLRGSWHDMGRQYGKSFGKYVRIVYDGYYNLFKNSQLPADKLGPVIDRYMNESEKLSPEAVEFIRGIAKGAGPELDGADNAAALTNAQKIMFINCLFEVVIPPAWPHVAQLMGVTPSVTAASISDDFEPFNSHTWSTWGDMTRSHNTILGGTRDQPWFPTLYNVSYVAIPSDRRAGITWSNSIAGLVVASAQVNEFGVGMGNTIVSHKTQYFGVPALVTTAHISFFARSAQEAADIYTIGTPAYRAKTGRKTLASTVGFFETFGDSKHALVVERTGRHYAVRTAGDQNEHSDFVVLPNHALAPYSFDEFRQPTGRPMQDWTIPAGESSSSVSRYWALYYEFDKNIGQVTPRFAQETIAPLKHTYTPDGQLVTEKNGIPVWRLGLTPERWIIPNPADPNSLPTGGNNMYFVADLDERKVRWIQGIPSHWQGKWDQVSLRDFADYR